MENTDPKDDYIEVIVSESKPVPSALNAVGDEFSVGTKHKTFTRERVTNKVVQVSVNLLQENIRHACQTMMNSLSSIDTENSKFEIDEVTFNMVFDKKGAVKILSVVEGEISSQTGISITLKPKRNE